MSGLTYVATRGNVTSDGSRWLGGIEAKVWTGLTGQRLKRGRVGVVVKDVRAALAAVTLAALRPEDGLAAVMATHEMDRLGVRLERLHGRWSNAAVVLGVVVDAIDGEEHDRLMAEAERLADGDQGD